MTYTKKKIAIEVEVPDGATHYSVIFFGLHWWKSHDLWLRWNHYDRKWEKYDEIFEVNKREIEVIE